VEKQGSYWSDMPESLIVSFIGDDRPGIVQVIANVVARHGGSWQESRMSGLGGYFSGTARILINSDSLEALDQSLQALEGLTCIIRPLRQTSPDKTTQKMKLDIVGPDRPGILQDVTSQLVGYGINVIEMETEVRPASMSGELNFIADALVGVPNEVDIESLDKQLDAIARNLGLDILFEESAGE
jgi:glycine cleavage system regulatory protein|tara:strand:- start:1404 stop:1958 length:555 start_codon:yes stop_codon:yes gene_type:complete